MLKNNDFKKTLIKKCINELRFDLYAMNKALTENDFCLYSKLCSDTLTKIMFMFKIGIININQYDFLFKIWKNPKNIKNPIDTV